MSNYMQELSRMDEQLEQTQIQRSMYRRSLYNRNVQTSKLLKEQINDYQSMCDIVRGMSKICADSNRLAEIEKKEHALTDLIQKNIMHLQEKVQEVEKINSEIDFTVDSIAEKIADTKQAVRDSKDKTKEETEEDGTSDNDNSKLDALAALAQFLKLMKTGGAAESNKAKEKEENE